jgi:hypothetical protein
VAFGGRHLSLDRIDERDVVARGCERCRMNSRCSADIEHPGSWRNPVADELLNTDELECALRRASGQACFLIEDTGVVVLDTRVDLDLFHAEIVRAPWRTSASISGAELHTVNSTTIAGVQFHGSSLTWSMKRRTYRIRWGDRRELKTTRQLLIATATAAW